MTRYTITSSGTVHIDDLVIMIGDTPEYDSDFNAVQFNGNTSVGTGEVEWDKGIPPTPITTLNNLEELIGLSIETIIARRDAAKIIQDASYAEMLLGPNGDGT